MKNISTYIIGVAFILAGVNHFINPEFYLRMMPPVLPEHELLNYVSGIAEIILGAMLFIPKIKVVAAWGLIILLIAVFPANIYMAMEAGKSIDVSPIIAYIRLPFQFLFIWLVYKQTK
ncbi:MAG: MauE/DoxX family redox-associated membrane protein [Bacteroidia bacterium]